MTADEREKLIELRDAAADYVRLVQVEKFRLDDIAVHRAYERLRKALDHDWTKNY